MRSHQDVTGEFNQRLLRLLVWSMIMLFAFVVTAFFDLRKTIFVPLFFVPLMVPVALLPFKKTKNAGEPE